VLLDAASKSDKPRALQETVRETRGEREYEARVSEGSS
jgi:hypothetical protein